jgi:hypothetical protein
MYTCPTANKKTWNTTIPSTNTMNLVHPYSKFPFPKRVQLKIPETVLGSEKYTSKVPIDDKTATFL